MSSTIESASTIGAEAMLKILIDVNTHNDRLIWNQLQTMIALEGATLTGGYLLRGTVLSGFVILLGIAFLVLLYLYVERLRENRDMNMPIVDRLIESYATAKLKNILGAVEGRRLRLSAPIPQGKHIFWTGPRRSVKGQTLLSIAFMLFALADLVALALFPCLLGVSNG
jgi:hypothetical protein